MPAPSPATPRTTERDFGANAAVFEKMTMQICRKGQMQHLPFRKGRETNESTANFQERTESKQSLREHLEEHGKTNNSQRGFVKTKLGQTNLISSSDRVAGLVLGEDAGDVICLYFRKAFQAVSHDILISTPGNGSILQFGCT